MSILCYLAASFFCVLALLGYSMGTLVDPPSLAFEQKPAAVMSAGPGERVILTCEVFGSPPPAIRWLRDGRPTGPLVGNGNDVEREKNGELVTIQASLTKSQLILDCVDAESAGVYVCSASNGHSTIHAETTLTVRSPSILQKNPPSNNLPLFGFWKKKRAGEMCAVKKRERGEGAKIVMWTEIRMERPDAAVQLFCRATGEPRPSVHWYLVETTESGEETLSPLENTSNIELLENGDLLIRDPVPEDEGSFEFACKAVNAMGSDEKRATLVATPLE